MSLSTPKSALLRSLRIRHLAAGTAGCAIVAAAGVLAHPLPDSAPAGAQRVTADVVLVSDTPTRPSPRSRTSTNDAWLSKTQSALKRLNTAISDFQTAIDAKDYPALQDACRRVGSAGHSIESALPAPSQEATDSLTAAAGNFAAAGSKCDGLTAEAGGGAVQTVIADIKTGMGNVHAAQAALGAG